MGHRVGITAGKNLYTASGWFDDAGTMLVRVLTGTVAANLARQPGGQVVVSAWIGVIYDQHEMMVDEE